MHPLVFFVIAGLSSLCAVGIIEDKIIPRLSDKSRFKKWWRNNIISDYEGPGNL